MPPEMAIGDKVAEYRLVQAQIVEIGAITKGQEKIY